MELQRRASPDSIGYPLPYAFASPAASASAKATTIFDSDPIRLLLVEHDPNYAVYVKGLFESSKGQGLEIEWTRWLDVAARRIKEGRVDAVLLDISLPDISGVEIFRAIHRAGPYLPVLIMADLDDEALACRLIREGAQDYLPKHALTRQGLHRALRFAVERGKAQNRAGRKKDHLFACPISKDRSLLSTEALQVNLPPPPESPSIPFQSTEQLIRILVLEHSDGDYRKLQACVSGHKEIRLTRAKTIWNAFRTLSRRPFDLVCLDYLLPDGTGHDFMAKMRDSGLEIPAVVITAHNDPMAAAQMIQAGAYDFLPKQKLNPSPLFRIIMNSLERSRLRKQIRKAREKIIEISIQDDLTGLYNRRYFTQVLEKEIGRASRYASPLSLFMMDVDKFKSVNDTCGHQGGDMVLRELGKMLRQSVRLSDTICRYGGEEFALLLPNTEPCEAKALGERLRSMVENHAFEWQGRSFRITLSLGLSALGRETLPSSAGLLDLADKALYEAKGQGKNRLVCYDEGLLNSDDKIARTG
jgi:diguanylate cyclase (GGDEF)-like protein